MYPVARPTLYVTSSTRLAKPMALIRRSALSRMRASPRLSSIEAVTSLLYAKCSRSDDPGKMRKTLDDCSDTSPSTLTARELCQVLREVVLGRQTMTKVGTQSWEQVYACHFEIDLEGSWITIYSDCDELD